MVEIFYTISLKFTAHLIENWCAVGRVAARKVVAEVFFFYTFLFLFLKPPNVTGDCLVLPYVALHDT